MIRHVPGRRGGCLLGRLGAIKLGVLAEPQLLIARGILPAQYGSAKKQHLDALAGGQRGRDARVAVGDVDLGLGRKARRRGKR